MKMLIDDITRDRMSNRGKPEREVEFNLLTSLYSDLTMEQKNSGAETITDDDVIRVLNKYKKNNDESLKLLSDDDPRREDYQKELEVLLSYLPKQLSQEELVVIIRDAKENGMDNIRAVMGHLKKNYNGQFNPKEASQAAKEVLG